MKIDLILSANIWSDFYSCSGQHECERCYSSSICIVVIETFFTLPKFDYLHFIVLCELNLFWFCGFTFCFNLFSFSFIYNRNFHIGNNIFNYIIKLHFLTRKSGGRVQHPGLQLMFFWVGESIIEVGELGKMVPLRPPNFAVRRALIRPLGDGGQRERSFW